VLAENGRSSLARVWQWVRGLGEDEKKPVASPSGIFWALWAAANGTVPARGDRISKRVFLKRIAKVEVSDTLGETPYSKVKRVIAFLPSSASGPVQVGALSHAKAEGGRRKGEQDREQDREEEKQQDQEVEHGTESAPSFGLSAEEVGFAALPASPTSEMVAVPCSTGPKPLRAGHKAR
jgi:hypothetical protein